MSNEDKKLQKHLVDEMMKVYETNPSVIIYMQSLMENYEKLEQENKKLKEEANDYKSRCEFAIELMDTYGCYNDILEIKLYNCLRGEDDE